MTHHWFDKYARARLFADSWIEKAEQRGQFIKYGLMKDPQIEREAWWGEISKQLRCAS